MTDLMMVYIVEDDASTRKALSRLIRSIGYEAEAFVSADDFLSCECTTGPCCLVLDLQMPGLNGLELQERLAERGSTVPIIFVTGHASVPVSVQAMKAGAVEFLEKPYDADTLINAIHSSIEGAKIQTEERKVLEDLQNREARMTPREHEVFGLVVSGLLNKQIARQLGISEKTVKVHRARVMEKMEVRTLAKLVHLAEKLVKSPLEKVLD